MSFVESPRDTHRAPTWHLGQWCMQQVATAFLILITPLSFLPPTSSGLFNVTRCTGSLQQQCCHLNDLVTAFPFPHVPAVGSPGLNCKPAPWTLTPVPAGSCSTFLPVASPQLLFPFLCATSGSPLGHTLIEPHVPPPSVSTEHRQRRPLLFV